MKENSQRHKILFIDSGQGYGGSSMALYNILSHINRGKFEPLVAFYFYNKVEIRIRN